MNLVIKVCPKKLPKKKPSVLQFIILLTTFINETNLVQLVNFETWTRTINGVRKESTLDHVYEPKSYETCEGVVGLFFKTYTCKNERTK